MKWPEKKFDDITLAEKHRCEGWNECLEACKAAWEETHMQSHRGDCNIYTAMVNGGDNDGICDCGYGRYIFSVNPDRKFEEGIYYSKERLSSTPVERESRLLALPTVDEIERVFTDWLSSVGESRLTPDDVNELVQSIHNLIAGANHA